MTQPVKEEVGWWPWSPIPKHEFFLHIYSDGSCDLFESSRFLEPYRSRGPEVFLIYHAFQDTDPQMIARKRTLTHRVTLPNSLKQRIIEVTRFLSESDTNRLTAIQEKEIEDELNALFWNEWNPILKMSLDRQTNH